MHAHGQPTLIEQLSTRRLAESKASDVCPACGGIKTKGVLFCPMCLGRLTPEIAGELHLPFDGGGDRAVLRAMRHLGAAKLITTMDQPIAEIRRVPMWQVSVEQAKASAASTICPKCGVPRKPLGAAVCYVCLSTLSAALVGQARRRRFDGGQRFDALMKSIDPAALQLAPEEYLRALRIVFRYMRAPVFRVIFLED